MFRNPRRKINVGKNWNKSCSPQMAYLHRQIVNKWHMSIKLFFEEAVFKQLFLHNHLTEITLLLVKSIVSNQYFGEHLNPGLFSDNQTSYPLNEVLPPGLKKTHITYPGLNWVKREFHKKDSVMKMYCTVLASLVLTLCECDWWHKFHWFGIIFSKYINLETVKARTTKYSTIQKYKNLGYTENVLFD